MAGTAGIYNGIIDQGATWTLNLVYNDYNGNPVNLTGYTARLQLRSKFDSSSVLTLSTGSGITITGPSGQIAIEATATQTQAIASGIYIYDLELTLGAEITRLIQGQMTVRENVTANV